MCWWPFRAAEIPPTSSKRCGRPAELKCLRSPFWGLAGELAQGDALYIKKVEAHKLSKIKLVKIIALLSLFGQIDSAADLVKEGLLAEHFQFQWLDLAAQMFGHKNYADLMLKWTKTPQIFYRDGIID